VLPVDRVVEAERDLEDEGVVDLEQERRPGALLLEPDRGPGRDTGDGTLWDPSKCFREKPINPIKIDNPVSKGISNHLPSSDLLIDLSVPVSDFRIKSKPGALKSFDLCHFPSKGSLKCPDACHVISPVDPTFAFIAPLKLPSDEVRIIRFTPNSFSIEIMDVLLSDEGIF
jgi:hypothetical protein